MLRCRYTIIENSMFSMIRKDVFDSMKQVRYLHRLKGIISTNKIKSTTIMVEIMEKGAWDEPEFI